MWVEDLKPDTNLFALFVSRSGGGKTTAAASFPKPEFMDFDGRINSLILSKHIYNQKVSFEQYLPGKGWSDVDKYVDSMIMQVLGGNCPFQTLTVDSLTAFTNLMLGESLEIQGGRTISSGGKKGLRMPGPADYGYESTATKQFLDNLRLLSKRMNVILTAHIIPRFGKPSLRDTHGNVVKAKDGTDVQNPYAESEEIGEKVSLRDKLGVDASIYFNEVYRFEKRTTLEGSRYFVNFDTDIARSALGLKGEHDITDLNFYEFWKGKVAELAAKNGKV